MFEKKKEILRNGVKQLILIEGKTSPGKVNTTFGAIFLIALSLPTLKLSNNSNFTVGLTTENAIIFLVFLVICFFACYVFHLNDITEI